MVDIYIAGDYEDLELRMAARTAEDRASESTTGIDPWTVTGRTRPERQPLPNAILFALRDGAWVPVESDPPIVLFAKYRTAEPTYEGDRFFLMEFSPKGWPWAGYRHGERS